MSVQSEINKITSAKSTIVNKLVSMGLVSSGATLTEAATALNNYTPITFDDIYPVGAIYTSTVSTSPATLFGGTWEQITDTFLLTAGTTYTAGDTGGEAEHTLSVDELPSHRHSVYGNTWLNLSGGEQHKIASSSSGVYNTTETDHSTTHYGGYTGGGLAHNNMPPYLVVYAWKRTA